MNNYYGKIKILTLNIQKGWSLGKRKATLDQIKSCIIESGANVVCLQEVVGGHPDAEKKAQFEFLADGIWSHYVYGKNAVYSQGHHGNVILSEFPFISYENFDISNHRLEQRGLLYGVINMNCANMKNLHIFTVHMDITSWGRVRQIEKLCKLIEQLVPQDCPLIVCGDFNDWQETMSKYITKRIHLSEAYQVKYGVHAKTFPTHLPLLKLDRIYFRNLNLIHAQRLDAAQWHRLSDHLGLYAEFDQNINSIHFK